MQELDVPLTDGPEAALGWLSPRYVRCFEIEG